MCIRDSHIFRVRGYHPLWLHFPEHSTISDAKTCGWSHFARHYFGNLGWFLFLQLLRCFSSPRSLHTPMYSVSDDPEGRVSPFGNLRIKACLLAPRSLSQATTSFIAWYRQGIHHVHLFTCPYNVSLFFKRRYRASKYYVFACIDTGLSLPTADRQYGLIWYNHNPSAQTNNALASLACTNKSLLLPNC